LVAVALVVRVGGGSLNKKITTLLHQ